MYDAELPCVIYETFKSLGFEKFTICINNRKILNGLFTSLGLKEKAVEILRIIDKIEKIGKEKVIEELESLGVKENEVNTIIKFIEIDGNTDEKLRKLKELGITEQLYEKGVEELEEVVKSMRIKKLPENNFKIELTIARGLDYYTGTVYETFLDDYRTLGSVCSGGRYENLAELYTDKKLPGVGISIGLTRFFYQMKKENILENEERYISKVLVVPMANEQMEYSETVANKLRMNDINTEMFLEDKKLKAKFKYADKLNIPYVAVIGEEEEKENKVTLKNMQTGEQETLKLEEIIEKIK